LEVLSFEEKLYSAKEVEVIEQYLYAKEVLHQSAGTKSNDPKMYEALEKEYESRKTDQLRFQAEKHLALVIILLNKSDVYKAMKNYDMSSRVLMKIIDLGRKPPESVTLHEKAILTGYLKNAHIQIAENLCVMSSVNNAGQ